MDCSMCGGTGRILTTGCYWSDFHEEVVHRCACEGVCGPCPKCNEDGEATNPGEVELCADCGATKGIGYICHNCPEE